MRETEKWQKRKEKKDRTIKERVEIDKQWAREKERKTNWNKVLRITSRIKESSTGTLTIRKMSKRIRWKDIFHLLFHIKWEFSIIADREGQRWETRSETQSNIKQLRGAKNNQTHTKHISPRNTSSARRPERPQGPGEEWLNWPGLRHWFTWTPRGQIQRLTNNPAHKDTILSAVNKFPVNIFHPQTHPGIIAFDCP